MRKPTFVLLALVLAAALCVRPAEARDYKTISVSVLGGIGGSIDEDEAGLGNSAWQAGLSLVVTDKLLTGLRVGTIDLEIDEPTLPGTFDSKVDYVTWAGEYRFNEGWYDSGVIIGLGLYDAPGADFGRGESALGLQLGVSGDFEMNPTFSIAIELNSHLVGFDSANVFLTALAGVAVHF